MAQIQILEHIVYADGSTSEIRAIVTHEGCGLCFVADAMVVNLTWDQLVDAEHLSNVFEDITVRVFKVIVGMLGKIHAYKDMYMSLI